MYEIFPLTFDGGPGINNFIVLHYYRPQTKLLEGNVFTGVCLFTGGFCLFPSCNLFITKNSFKNSIPRHEFELNYSVKYPLDVADDSSMS